LHFTISISLALANPLQNIRARSF